MFRVIANFLRHLRENFSKEGLWECKQLLFFEGKTKRKKQLLFEEAEKIKKEGQKYQKGILTIDFIFSFTIVLGLFQVFYVLSYTLMVAHLTQYLTFASARLFFAGHVSVTHQKELAEKKFNDLVQNTPAKYFYKDQFGLDSLRIEEFNYNTSESFRYKYVGVQVQFKSKILDFNVPFLGSTSSELGPDGFSAYLGSYLYREPTADECFKFNESRIRGILSLMSKFEKVRDHVTAPENVVAIIADNGC